MFYDYICPECEAHKEENHSIIEDPKVLCDKCKTVMKRRITGGTGTIYKGNGWGGTRPNVDSSQAKRTTIKANVEKIKE